VLVRLNRHISHPAGNVILGWRNQKDTVYP
jgi:hypothetical protein